MTIIEAERKYKEDIDKHIENVKNQTEIFIECMTNYVTCDEALEIFNRLRYNVKNHDSSKYNKEEFDAYRKNFYPISE